MLCRLYGCYDRERVVLLVVHVLRQRRCCVVSKLYECNDTEHVWCASCTVVTKSRCGVHAVGVLR